MEHNVGDLFRRNGAIIEIIGISDRYFSWCFVPSKSKCSYYVTRIHSATFAIENKIENKEVFKLLYF